MSCTKASKAVLFTTVEEEDEAISNVADDIEQQSRHFVLKHVDGKQVWERIAEISDQYRSKGDVIPLINAREPGPLSTNDARVADFAEKEYLPWAKANKKPATYNGYEKLWKARLEGHVGSIMLSEYRPHHCSRFLGSLAPTMTSASLQHIRALLSGIFAHTVADGRIDVNPVRDAKCSVNPKLSRKREHYTAAEMRGILAVLTGQARIAMAFAFVGMRPAEIVGLQWDDATQDAIHVERSMWRGHISDGGKSKRSRRIIPLGPFMIALLATYKTTAPSISGFVLENSSASRSADPGSRSSSAKLFVPRSAIMGIIGKPCTAAGTEQSRKRIVTLVATRKSRRISMGILPE